MTDSDVQCPSCGAKLSKKNNKSYCPQCSGNQLTNPSWARKSAGYALSMPERISRIAVGSAAGIVKGTFDFRFIDPRTWESPEEIGDHAEIKGNFDFNYSHRQPEQPFI